MQTIRYFLIVLFLQASLGACRCEICLRNIPEEIQVPPLLHCTEYTHYEPQLGLLKTDNPKLFETELKEHVKKYNNAAGMIVSFPDGTRKSVYRSGYLGENPEAIQELVKERHVETMINIHNTDKFDSGPWIEKEKALFYSYGGKEYIYISDFNYNFANAEQKDKVMQKIASIIKLIQQSEGNVLFHCMGGEHRSGIIYGVLHKCYHKIAMESIIQEYKCHAAWQSEEQPGGYNPNNEELIRDFPVEYLNHTRGIDDGI